MPVPPPPELLALLERGDVHAAVAWIERAELAPADALYYRALALAAGGEPGRALEAVRAALGIEIGDPDLLELVAALEQLAATTPSAATSPGWDLGCLAHDRWEVFGSARGGMGQVFFVRDREWGGKQLAVKSLLLASDGEASARAELFRREARVWLDLGGHSNIVSGYYTLVLDGALRFFMEFVPGRPLATVVRDEPLPPARVLDLAIQLAVGMRYVHARGVVHRDLKPDNCLIDPDDGLRITDFGLGKRIGHRDTDAVALAPAPLSNLSLGGAGTPSYMAPEQWRALAAASAPADVYAFGILLYELVAGCRPFDEGLLPRYEARLPAHLRAFAAGGAPPLNVLRLFHESIEPLGLGEVARQPVPDELALLAARALDKHPERRPDFDEVRHVLLALHERWIGPYRRELTAGVTSTSAGENNRAVSYYVMGDVAAARALLEGIEAADPAAPLPRINRQVLEINERTRTPAEAAPRLREALERASQDNATIARLRVLLDAHALPHRGPTSAFALSADGTRALSASSRGDVRLWHSLTGEPLGRDELDAPVTAVAFLDGDPVVATSNGALLRLRDRQRLPCPGRITSLSTTHGAIAVTDGTTPYVLRDGAWVPWSGRVPEGAGVATCAGNVVLEGAAVEIYDREGSRWFRHELAKQRDLGAVVGGLLPEARGEEVTAIAILDGVVALATMRRFVFDYDRPQAVLELFSFDGSRLASARLERPVVAIGGTATLVATGADDGTIAWWPADLAAPRVLGCHEARITAIALVGEHVLAAGTDGTTRRWSLHGVAANPTWPLVVEQTLSARERETLDERVHRLVQALDTERWRDAYAELEQLRASHAEYERDRDLAVRIAAALRPRATRIGLRASSTGEPVATRLEARCLATRDGRVAIGAADGTVALVEGGQVRAVGAPARGAVRALGLLADAVLVAGDAGVELRGLDGRERQRWGGLFGKPKLATAGREAVIVVDGGRVERWHGTTRGERLKTAGELLALAAHDDSLAVGGYADGRVAWFDFRAGTVKALPAHRDRCTAVAVHDTLAATAGYDREIVLWEVASGTEVARLPGHRGWIAALAFSDDGRWLLSGGGDQRVRLWDTRTRRGLVELAGHARTVRGLAFHPGALASVTIDEVGTMLRHELEPRWGT